MQFGRSQLGWRLHNADALLYTPLFKFGYLERIHIIKHGEVTKRWESFKEELFAKQDGFVQKKDCKTSAKAIREQWEGRIEQFIIK